MVAIIGLLVSLLLPSLSKAREQTKRIVCASNIRQLNTACVLHAQEHRAGLYIAVTDTGEDNFAHIYPKYLPNPDLAICPSTVNIIRKDKTIPPSKHGYPTRVLLDLTRPAAHRADARGGHSYEIWGWYDGPSKYPDGRIIDGTRLGTKSDQMGLRPGDPFYTSNATVYGCVVKKHSQVKQPSTTLLVLDNDQGGTGNVNNWPDALDNHAPHGLNIGFLDGHTEWVPRSARIVRIYLKSYADPPSNWQQVDPKLRRKAEGNLLVWYYAP